MTSTLPKFTGALYGCHAEHERSRPAAPSKNTTLLRIFFQRQGRAEAGLPFEDRVAMVGLMLAHRKRCGVSTAAN
jgi:hypothetical protein